MKPIRYLLVEDQAPDQFYTEVLIRNDQPKATVEVAADGRQALDALMRASDLAPVGAVPAPDVILLDINMPRMNGFEFLDAFTDAVAHGRLKQRPIILMLASSEGVADRDRASRYDCVQGYLVKPIDIATLNQLLAGAMDATE